jgi:hypothetical protein
MFFTEAILIYICNRFVKEIKQHTIITVILFYNRLVYKMIPATRVTPVD